MVAKTKLKRSKNGTINKEASASAFVVATPITQSHSKHRKIKQMFRGLNTKPQSNKKSNATEEDDVRVLRDDCRAELHRYMRDETDGACPLHNEDESFNDPLKWWSVSSSKYILVADLARVFLAILATFAPSERIWKKAARILSLRRARLQDQLVSRMMFVKENAKLLRKHILRNSWSQWILLIRNPAFSYKRNIDVIPRKISGSLLLSKALRARKRIDRSMPVNIGIPLMNIMSRQKVKF
jgi:hypothetical protein